MEVIQILAGQRIIVIDFLKINGLLLADLIQQPQQICKSHLRDWQRRFLPADIREDLIQEMMGLVGFPLENGFCQRVFPADAQKIEIRGGAGSIFPGENRAGFVIEFLT